MESIKKKTKTNLCNQQCCVGEHGTDLRKGWNIHTYYIYMICVYHDDVTTKDSISVHNFDYN